MAQGLLELKATPGPQARAVCGCTFLYAKQQAFDLRSCTWYAQTVLCTTPCSPEHHEMALEAMGPAVRKPADSMLLAAIAADMTARVSA